MLLTFICLLIVAGIGYIIYTARGLMQPAIEYNDKMIQCRDNRGVVVWQWNLPETLESVTMWFGRSDEGDVTRYFDARRSGETQEKETVDLAPLTDVQVTTVMDIIMRTYPDAHFDNFSRDIARGDWSVRQELDKVAAAHGSGVAGLITTLVVVILLFIVFHIIFKMV